MSRGFRTNSAGLAIAFENGLTLSIAVSSIPHGRRDREESTFAWIMLFDADGEEIPVNDLPGINVRTSQEAITPEQLVPIIASAAAVNPERF